MSLAAPSSLNNITSSFTSANIAKGIVRVAAVASTGAIGASLFTVIPPAGGAIFGLALDGALQGTDAVINKVFGNTTAEKIVKFAFVLFGSFYVASKITSLAGYAMTMTTGLYFSVALIPAAYITAFILNILGGSADL